MVVKICFVVRWAAIGKENCDGVIRRCVRCLVGSRQYNCLRVTFEASEFVESSTVARKPTNRRSQDTPPSSEAGASALAEAAHYPCQTSFSQKRVSMLNVAAHSLEDISLDTPERELTCSSKRLWRYVRKQSRSIVVFSLRKRRLMYKWRCLQPLPIPLGMVLSLMESPALQLHPRCQ